jgi:hypothetical protein
MTGTNELISQREATRRYGFRAATLKKRREDGRLPVFTNPMNDRTLLYRVADIERLATPRPATPRTETASAA